MTVPTSTYRLQVRASFDLDEVAGLCGYLADLGVGALYLSPLLPSAAGSGHGYDVVRFDGVDEARGGVAGWRRMLRAARGSGLKVVVDIVPNHAGVADAAENPAWWSLLREGRSSPYAAWFDVDWDSGPILLPVLGDDREPAPLEVAGDALVYAGMRFPLAPGTAVGTPEQVHERQHYRLVGHRRADAEQNYRRFFAVSTLAGLRVEDDAVFAATHRQVARWLHEDGVDGVRVDHPDGLADPRSYLRRLRGLAGPDAWITVEKILEPGEALPGDWPVAGTTGYDALREVASVFVDPGGIGALDTAYRELTGDTRTFAQHAAAGKREVAGGILRAEVLRLARLASRVPHAAEALAELAVAFPVYRSYLPEGADRLASALAAARAARPELASALDALSPRLHDPADELCVRFQQTTGAIMAKGVEDSAYYRYTRFVAANEVGGDPSAPAGSLAGFHDAQRRRQRDAPQSMTTLSTHDTKRGEDVRARLAVLSEAPARWAAVADILMRAAPIPDASFGYLLWQTFVGAGFIERGRMHRYAEKAMREAGTATGWAAPDPAFEAAVHAAVDRGYDDPAVRAPLQELIGDLTPHGWSNSLGQKLVQLTMPGVPDVYQGCELWEDSLVDPDNRRPVDFEARRTRLAALDAAGPPQVDATGTAKLWVVSRALRLRRDRPELFTGYRALHAHGPAADHAIAFDRGGAITLATRLPVGLRQAGGWRDTVLDLGAAPAIDILTDRVVTGETALADLLATYPVALLVRGLPAAAIRAGRAG